MGRGDNTEPVVLPHYAGEPVQFVLTETIISGNTHLIDGDTDHYQASYIADYHERLDELSGQTIQAKLTEDITEGDYEVSVDMGSSLGGIVMTHIMVPVESLRFNGR